MWPPPSPRRLLDRTGAPSPRRSIAEICGALGLRESAGKQAIFRAVKKLRRVLEPLYVPRASREVLP